MTMKTTIKYIFPAVLAISFLTPAFAADAPQRAAPAAVALNLGPGKFLPTYVGFSPSAQQICITGDMTDEWGAASARLMLVDRKSNSMAWQATMTSPEGVERQHAVQCVVAEDRVYLLANGDTSLSPPQAQTETIVAAYDLHGKRLAQVVVDLPTAGRHGKTSEVGYAIGATPDNLQVVGYTRDQDDETEHYGTYTVTLDRGLKPRGAPLVRHNGAYTGPSAARIVGDSIYVTGRFFKGQVTTNDIGDFSASRLRTSGGYVWSTPVKPGPGNGIDMTILEDGTSMVFKYASGATSFSRVTPDGKATALTKFASTYCDTSAVARYGNGVVAVREACAGKGSALVAIDTVAGIETRLRAIPDEPVFVATHGTDWIVLARDKANKTVFYSGTGGGL